MKPDPKRDELLRELYSRLRDLYGDRLDRLVLYGSHARGENRPESDLDVMVVLKGEIQWPGQEIDRMIDTLYELDLKYEELISVVPVSKEDFLHKKTPLLLNVRREGIFIEYEAA